MCSEHVRCRRRARQAALIRGGGDRRRNMRRNFANPRQREIQAALLECGNRQHFRRRNHALPAPAVYAHLEHSASTCARSMRVHIHC